MDRRHAEHLSKMLSLMLRHRPEEFGVEVDRYGYADVEAVLAALQERTPAAALADIEHLVFHAEKQRFEIQEGRIRARYGHSIPIEMDRPPTEPPESLYQEVPPGDLDRIREEGLLPHDRRYVHLSRDPNRERDRRSGRRGVQVVVRVKAREAHDSGVRFYDCGPTVLTEGVPARFLEVPEAPPSPPPSLSSPDLRSVPTARRPETAPEPRNAGPVTFGRTRKTTPRR
jgi:putative RNA 2'-phosphotransferase